MKLNKYLKAVQALQAKAMNRADIKMFEADIRNYEDGETSVWATTQLIGEEEFHHFVLYTFYDKEQNDKIIAELTATVKVRYMKQWMTERTAWMDGENEGEGER